MGYADPHVDGWRIFGYSFLRILFSNNMSDFASYDKNGRTTGTPCIRICKISPEHGLCEGCWRSIDEVEQWDELTDEQKERVMIAIDIRKELLCEEVGQS